LKHEITNLDKILATTHNTESVEGWLSPPHRITLPPMVKQGDGIRVRARSFAFMYPPEGRAELSKMVQRFDNNDVMNCIRLVGRIPLNKKLFVKQDLKVSHGLHASKVRLTP